MQIEKTNLTENTKSAKILVVDDETLNLNFLATLLENHGFTVDQLSSGKKVMQTVKEAPPDLILLDILMSPINGIEVCRCLKADASTRDIPVIFLSALKEADDIVEAFSVGGVDYIVKPFRNKEVIARVNTHIALRKTQQSLQENKKNLESIFNASSAMIIITDMQGNIVDANPMAVQKYGYSKDEFLKMSVTQLLHPDNSHLFETFTSFVKKKGKARIESKDVRKDGSTFMVEVQGSIAEYNGKPHFLGILKDITEQKQIEQNLIESKNAADSANRAKSNFLAVMSHEIRTPMNAIIGMTELTLQSDINSEQEHNLNVIKESAYLLLDIINDILDLSKIEAGKLTLEDIDFDLHQMLDNIVRIFTIPAERKGLSIHLEMADQLPQYIKADLIRLKQILANLTNNAIKFTETGNINIRVRQKNSSNLVFSVTDTGIGIPEDKYDQIFNSFTQADLSTTRSYGGSGLGLTICKKLTETMGGQINVISKPGFGSTFTFSIQFKQGDPKNVKMDSQLNNWEQLKCDSKELNILIVEDNLVNAKIADKFLSKMGHCSSIANNGKEALEYLSLEHFDLVLMDVEMPEMNGLEATKRIRKGEAGSTNIKIPVIAMTAHVLNEFRADCKTSGMDDFVSKPVNFYELGIIIKKYCALLQNNSKVNTSTQPVSSNELIVNKTEALKRLDGSEEIFEMICESFLEDIADVIDNLDQSLNRNDYEDVRFNAHTLKGLCANIGANSSIELAQQLEFMAKEGGQYADQLRPLFEKILKELDKVKEIIT